MALASPTLITFPPSLDAELSRFLLAHHRIRHREERHAIIFSSFVTLWRAHSPLFPLLYSESYRLDTVRKMIDHFEQECPEERKLLPAGPRDLVEADWKLFNATLGGPTSVFAYYHLLPHREIMIGPLAEGAPPFERRAVEVAYPVFAGLLRVLLRLGPERAKDALAQARAVLATVATRLSDGRRYLLGDRFSLSDMAFAVAAGPLVVPDEWGGALPPLEQMPRELRHVISETRGHPAGQFALRIYRDHRSSPSGSAADPG